MHKKPELPNRIQKRSNGKPKELQGEPRCKSYTARGLRHGGQCQTPSYVPQGAVAASGSGVENAESNERSDDNKHSQHQKRNKNKPPSRTRTQRSGLNSKNGASQP